MISKKTALISFAMIIGIGAIALFIILKSANFVDKAFQKSLQDNGFEITNIEKIEKRFGAIRYQNITLGSEEKSSISLLELSYKPLIKNNLSSIKINNIFLSGEIDINGHLNVKGIQDINSAFKNIGTLPDQISLKNINISLLSAHLGGIRATANLTGQRENNAIIWTGNIDSRQNQLELIAKLNAQTNDSGTWVADFEIENAKLERNFGKFTRVSGTLNWNGKNNTWDTLNGELNAGGLIAYNTAWQNANITINANPQSKKAFIAAKSSGIKGLELNTEITNNQKETQWVSDIHAGNGKELLDYFTALRMNPFDTQVLNEIKTAKNVNLRLKAKKNSLIFGIKDENQNIDTKGKIEKLNNQDYALIFKSSKNFQSGLKGAKCKKNGSKDTQICRVELTYKNGQYNLKN